MKFFGYTCLFLISANALASTCQVSDDSRAIVARLKTAGQTVTYFHEVDSSVAWPPRRLDAVKNPSVTQFYYETADGKKVSCYGEVSTAIWKYVKIYGCGDANDGKFGGRILTDFAPQFDIPDWKYVSIPENVMEGINCDLLPPPTQTSLIECPNLAGTFNDGNTNLVIAQRGCQSITIEETFRDMKAKNTFEAGRDLSPVYETAQMIVFNSFSQDGFRRSLEYTKELTNGKLQLVKQTTHHYLDSNGNFVWGFSGGSPEKPEKWEKVYPRK